MSAFFEQLAIQRQDDHRYYHHSRVNQTLHLISAERFGGLCISIHPACRRGSDRLVDFHDHAPVRPLLF